MINRLTQALLLYLFVSLGSIHAQSEVSLRSDLIKHGALLGDRHRAIVSTDIGGTDPDDFQSLVHLFVYADVIDLEGIVSSPYGPGRKQHILEVIDCYERDYEKLNSWSNGYPTPEKLRGIAKQGETEIAPYSGIQHSTEGSRWIIECAQHDDPRPLHVLVWGGLEDLAQALHDAPEILPKLRVYFIGGPNKKWSVNAYQYIVDHHPTLWIIEANSTYRGWFNGGVQDGEWGNTEFVKKHLSGHGALGDFFVEKMSKLKMGDSPTVAWLLAGEPTSPDRDGWGGKFVQTRERPYKTFTRLTDRSDEIELFGVAEFAFALGNENRNNLPIKMTIENQELEGSFLGDGTVRFRFCPKAVKTYEYKLTSELAQWNGKTGEITSVNPSSTLLKSPDSRLSNWWIDDPASPERVNEHFGAKSVSKWRCEYLEDFAKRMDRCTRFAP